jgi:transcriptional regulator GlxA family with amidase domain
MRMGQRRIYIDHGAAWTSTATTTVIDPILATIESDIGAERAKGAAQLLVSSAPRSRIAVRLAGACHEDRTSERVNEVYDIYPP